MKLRFCLSGKLRKGPELELFEKYLLRSEKIGKLINFSSIEIIEYNGSAWTKSLLEQSFTKRFSHSTIKVLLDEKGKNYDSREFARFLKIKFHENKKIVFAIGGAFGFSENLYSKSAGLISLSKMTFSHQIIRLFFSEQLYRAFTILNNHPYHND